MSNRFVFAYPFVADNSADGPAIFQLIPGARQTGNAWLMKAGLGVSWSVSWSAWSVFRILKRTSSAILPGYTEMYRPEFYSTATDFLVILKKVNYVMDGATGHDTGHDPPNLVSDQMFD